MFFDNSRIGGQKRNFTMGWKLGFRKDNYNIVLNTELNETVKSIEGESIVDLYGPKYLYIYLDDFNQNRVNNTVINLSDSGTTLLEQPTYYAPDLNIVENPNGIPEVLAEFPRRNTAKQRYAMNQIFESRTNGIQNLYLSPPVTTNIFNVIPIKKNGMPVGDTIIEFGGSLQSGERIYFGPVNIKRFEVRLLDERGLPVNLNGCDWSFSMLCETLYTRN